MGLVASAPLGAGFGVYGNFAYGFLQSDFEQKIGQREIDLGDEESQPYILFEGGFTYTHTTEHLPAYMPLSLATVYAGYRYQDFETELGTSGMFDDNVARDVTRGFVAGVNLTY